MNSKITPKKWNALPDRPACNFYPVGPVGRRIADVQDAVCKAFNIPLVDLCGKTRVAEYVTARHVGMWLCRYTIKTREGGEPWPALSYPAIGRAFGDRDHTTAMGAIVKINNLLEVDYMGLREVVHTLWTTLSDRELPQILRKRTAA